MRAGDANRRLGVSAIFHSKRLNNDELSNASSRLVGGSDCELMETDRSAEILGKPSQFP
jgi:hypothetical protein